MYSKYAFALFAALAVSASSVADEPLYTTYCKAPPTKIGQAGTNLKFIWGQFEGLTGLRQLIAFPNQYGAALSDITNSTSATLYTTCYSFLKEKEFTFQNAIQLDSETSKFISWGPNRAALCDVVVEIKLLAPVDFDYNENGTQGEDDQGPAKDKDAAYALEIFNEAPFVLRQCARGDTGSIE